MARIGALESKVEQLGYDAYLVTDEMNVRYLTGIPVPQSPFLLVRAEGHHVLYVNSDGLRTAVSSVGKECDVKAADVSGSSLELFLTHLPQMHLGRVAFDTLSAEAYLKLTEKAKDTTFIPDSGTMWALRIIKSNDEIEHMRKAAKIADEGHKVAAEVIRPGIREYEVAAEVEHAMRILGSEDEGHRLYVTSGATRTASGVASGYTTDRKINEGEIVVVDFGATVNGYRSDIGRTYIAGKPTERQRAVYSLVRKAWSAAFACVRPGAVAGDVDAAARKIFGEDEKYFNHEAGHGIGLSLPEPPALIKNSKDILRENMIVTVEPGLYFEGFGGMVVEDTTLVVKDGAQRLSAPPLDWN